MTGQERSDQLYITKSRAIAARVLGDEAIIMSAVDSTLFSLNSTGTIIWEAADGQTPVAEIIRNRLCPEFDITYEEAETDATHFIDELVKHGLLEVSPTPIGFSERLNVPA